MNTHRYLRAYMAGIAVPTMMLVVALSAFLIAHYVCQISIPIERVIIFPMALVPNVFGLWNIFYVYLRPRRHLPIGLHGAILPFILGPTGFTLATLSGFLAVTSSGFVLFREVTVPYPLLAMGFVFALIAYYLIWKYLVGFLNEVLGIA